MPITIIGALMTIGPAKTVRLRVNLGTQRERPLWETFTITKKDGADGPSYALSCVSERPPAFWQDVSGAFDDPINDMCAGNADLWVETKRRTKRGAYGEVHASYAYTFSFKDASNVEKLVHLVAERYAFEAEVRRGAVGRGKQHPDHLRQDGQPLKRRHTETYLRRKHVEASVTSVTHTLHALPTPCGAVRFGTYSALSPAGVSRSLSACA